MNKETKVKILEGFLRAEEEEEVTYCKVTTPAQGVVEIDKFKLQKLLQSKPPPATPIEEQKHTYLRCNREDQNYEVWEAYVDGQRRNFTSGILVNANLKADEKDIRVGCGGSYHIGMAAGYMVSENHPVKVPLAQVRRLIFDDSKGVFMDRESRAVIKSCDYLMLKPECHAEWIASPAQVKILNEMTKLARKMKNDNTSPTDYWKAKADYVGLQHELDKLGKPELPTKAKGTK